MKDNDSIISTTIEILGKPYPIKCTQATLTSLNQAAKYLDQQMREVRDSGKVINLERIAIITALNITHQYLELDQKKNSMMGKINHRIAQLHEKIETAIKKPIQHDFLCAEES